MAGAMAMTELLNLFFKPDQAKELRFKDLGGPMVLGPGSLDRLAHGTDPLTGVNPATSIDWSTAAEREAFLTAKAPSFLEQLLHFLATTGAMIGGAKLGNFLGQGGPTFTNAYGTKSFLFSASSGIYPGYGMAAGGLVDGSQLALIGEAGAEAVIPLKGGQIPTMRSPSGGLLATMPSGDRVPIRLPAFATGGVLGQPIAPTALPESTTGTVWRGGQPSAPGQAGRAERPITVNFPERPGGPRAMSTLRHRVARLERLTRCPQHSDQPLLCADSDPRPLSAAEWHELAQLLQQAGYLEPLEHAPIESLGRCWRCGADALVCLLCLSDRGAPPGVDRLDGEALDRLSALGAKLLPPWLEDTGGPYDGHAP